MKIDINDILYIEKIKSNKKLEITLYRRNKICLNREEIIGLI